LRSIPRLGGSTRRLAVIPGVVPSPTDWPTGCRFHARCPYGWEKTRLEEPPLFEVAPGRKTKCWLVEFPERREEIRRPTRGSPSGRAHPGWLADWGGSESPPPDRQRPAAGAVAGDGSLRAVERLPEPGEERSGPRAKRVSDLRGQTPADVELPRDALLLVRDLK